MKIIPIKQEKILREAIEYLYYADMYISTSFMQDTVNRLSFRLQKQFYCVTRISFNAQRKKKSIITFDIKKGPRTVRCRQKPVYHLIAL